MKLVKTLALLGVLIVLAAYVYFYEIKGGEEREKQQQTDEKVLNFESDSVQSIEIRSVFKQFRFERHEDGWKIASLAYTNKLP